MCGQFGSEGMDINISFFLLGTKLRLKLDFKLPEKLIRGVSEALQLLQDCTFFSCAVEGGCSFSIFTERTTGIEIF